MRLYLIAGLYFIIGWMAHLVYQMFYNPASLL